jgi:ParB-like chromosome segregation protein Spo0J
MREPISYIAHNGRNYVVDGHHRLLAAERLGLKEVPVQRVNLPFRGYTTVEDLMQFVP